MTVRTLAFFCIFGLLASAAASAVVGTWKVNAKGPDGSEHRLNFEIKEDTGKLAGTLVTEEGATVPVRDMKLDGGELSFRIEAEGAVWAVKLTVAGNSMKGKYTAESGESGPFEATR